MNKLIKSKKLRVLLPILIVAGLGIVIYGIPTMLMKNKPANNGVTNQDTTSNEPTGYSEAVYLIPISGGQITREDLNAHPEILAVTDFASLTSQTKRHIAIWIDKDAVNLLPEGWLNREPQKYYPIVLVGYNNALYSMREKLNLPMFGLGGPLVDWSKQKLEPGFSVWMIEKDSPNEIPAFMKGYVEPVTAERILEVSNGLLKKSFSIIEYKNTQYDFSFSLPLIWQGYSIAGDKWEGETLVQGSDVVVEQGPTLLIRHPEWTSQNPRQDIPIMIFTISQWDSLEKGKFHIGAAPVGPTKLGSNSKYVFALPPRYNVALPPGFEEVEQIFENNPLKTF